MNIQMGYDERIVKYYNPRQQSLAKKLDDFFNLNFSNIFNDQQLALGKLLVFGFLDNRRSIDSLVLSQYSNIDYLYLLKNRKVNVVDILNFVHNKRSIVLDRWYAIVESCGAYPYAAKEVETYMLELNETISENRTGDMQMCQQQQ